MGQYSSIEWTHHTFNPWWGCIKVSPACKHCYAEAWAKRFRIDVWGGRSSRRFFGDAHWREPLRWHREAESSNTRRRVFCASMGDVFEARKDLDAPRARLWQLITDTPALDWLLLTKRPERISTSVPWTDAWPANVWLGTTAETQLWADRRIPALLENNAVVRFLSCEPLLGPLDLQVWLKKQSGKASLDWIIAGGESGTHARPMHPEWVRSIQRQCRVAGVAFHFKQWGNWAPVAACHADSAARSTIVSEASSTIEMRRLTKRAAGRLLDGKEWDELPTPRRVIRRAAE
jgi:protein gp37